MLSLCSRMCELVIKEFVVFSWLIYGKKTDPNSVYDRRLVPLWG